MHKKKGFTLIELLVVIAIIALLLSILMPSLNKIKISARRVICRTNLHQWGLAFNGYEAANDGKNCSAFGYTNDSQRPGIITDVVPNEFWFEIANTTNVTYYDHPGQYSYELLASYMPSGFNPRGYTRMQIGALSPTDPAAKDLVLKGAWTCPSTRTPIIEQLQDTLPRIAQRGYMRLRFSYYGRSDLWANEPTNTVTNPEDFGGNEPGSRHLLMSDSLYAWQLGLDHNHSTVGKKTQWEIMTTTKEPFIAGLNKLMGDGSAYWKDRREFQRADSDPTLFDIPVHQGRRVSSISNQATNWY